MTIKESYFFVCGGDSDEEEYQPVLATYRNIAGYLGWTDKGIIRTGGLNADGDVEKSGLLEKAEEMGRNV